MVKAMSVSRPATRKIKDTLLHHTNLINGYLVNLRGTSTGADDNIFHIKREINTLLNLLSQLNGNYDEETQENIKAIIVTGKRISRHRKRSSILSSQQTFEDWIAEISSLKLTLTQSNGKEIKYSAERAIRVFLSYSHIDKILVGEIKKELEVSGIEAFLAHEDIDPSEEWMEEIIRSIKECDVFIPFINENFKESKWTDQESGIAFTRDKIIIPIDIGLVPYGFIGKYQALPYENSSDACEEIIETIMNKNPLMKKRIQDDSIKIFVESKRAHVQMIKDGLKTQMRRSISRFMVGLTYSIQPILLEAGIIEGQIHIIKKWVELRGHVLSEEEARAEGNYTPELFETHYETLHPGWIRRYAYEFRYVPTGKSVSLRDEVEA